MTASDRVRAHSAPNVNRRLDDARLERLRLLATQPRETQDERLRALEREWDTERVLESIASSLAFSGVVLAATVHRRWLLLPGVVTAFLLQHALRGWCPPLAIIRRLGVRTRREIDEEKYALKALRGDFDDTGPSRAPHQADAALARVQQ